MIPKIIHYCWFGRNPLPQLAKICIESWKQYFPDYEIVEWNEDNFDLEMNDYIKEAYQAKKWAFVSDYVRFYVLYKYGGVYFDTDVEVIGSFDEILERGAFMGMEENDNPRVCVAPGLGIASPKGHEIYKELLDFYDGLHFICEDGSENIVTIVEYTTQILKKHGLKDESRIQIIDGIVIYPEEYFCPISCSTGKKVITKRTRSIHWYTDSWGSHDRAKILNIERKFSKHGRMGRFCGRIITFPMRVFSKFRSIGFRGTIKFVLNKITKKSGV